MASKNNNKPARTLKQILFAEARKAHKRAGEPTEVAELLKLRKALYNKLEQRGVSRNTASVYLGMWQADLLAQLADA